MILVLMLVLRGCCGDFAGAARARLAVQRARVARARRTAGRGFEVVSVWVVFGSRMLRRRVGGSSRPRGDS